MKMFKELGQVQTPKFPKLFYIGDWNAQRIKRLRIFLVRFKVRKLINLKKESGATIVNLSMPHIL